MKLSSFIKLHKQKELKEKSPSQKNILIPPKTIDRTEFISNREDVCNVCKVYIAPHEKRLLLSGGRIMCFACGSNDIPYKKD